MAMPEIKVPEVKLPEFKLPDGLRDMSREDIVNAARDLRMPNRSDLPEIDLSKVEMPKVDFSKVELPKQIADRMPKRNRPNPILPIAGVLAIGAAIAAAWWLFTSSVTGPRIRSAVNDLKARMNGEPNDLVRYDSDVDLGSLVTDSSNAHSPSSSFDAYETSNGIADMGEGVPVGPGELPQGARSN
jgi:hypothetical protein